MHKGWSHEFDLKSVPEEVLSSIRDNIKMWDDFLQRRNEEILQARQEEVRRLEAEYKRLMGDNQALNVPEPKYRKWYFCPYMNSGGGGFVVDGQEV